MTERTVFISSTSKDLVEYRRAVYEAIEGLDGYHAVRMEDFGARDISPEEYSLQQAAQCDLFVGIIGHLYGYIPEGGELSITEQEYRAAAAADRSRLMFVMSEDVPLPASLREPDEKHEKLQAFRSKVLEEQIVAFFDMPEVLARQVVQAIRSWERGLETPESLSALLTPEVFSQRARHIALTGHEAELIGRREILDQIRSHLESQASVVILHGPGGVGKTRLLLALPEIAPEGAQLRYARTEAETIERDLATLDRDSQHVIVVDDAHRFDPLPHLREILVNPDFAGKVKLVLATRSIFSESVAFRFPQVPGDQIAEIEIGPLTNADIDRLLQNPPYDLADEDVRRTLVVIAEGNPLIAQIGAKLVQRGASVTGLTRDQVLTRYLDELIHDLAEAGYGDHYVAYLEVLAALGSLDLSNETLREHVQQVVSISQVEEERIVDRLVGAGLVERYWMILKIASEVLADHILISHFFDPRTKRADYQKRIIEPFLSLRPKQILTNLAEAEVKGESREAGLLLGRKLDELYRLVDSEGNIARCAVLDWLQDVAYLRPDDTMAMVARIVDGPEQPPETYHHPWWGSHEVGHDRVLDKAVDIVSRTIYRGALRDAVTYLYKIARYRPEAAEYARVREKARKALVQIAELKPRKPYAVQLTLLAMIPDWLTHDFAGSLELVLALIQPMLNMHFHSAETDPTEPSRISLRHGVLIPAEPLRSIREQALEILYEAYQQASTLSERLKIVQALDGAVVHFLPDMPVTDETRTWLRPDCMHTARFFSEIVVPTAELPVLHALSEWLWRARRFSRYQAEELDHLRDQLQSHDQYQLYRVLVGRQPWLEESGELDWQEVRRRREEEVNRYLDSLSEETIEQAVRDLDTIAGQARDAGETGTLWLNRLLMKLAERYPDPARQLVDRSLTEDLALKDHLSYVIAGLRCSAPDLAMAYIEAWTAGNDPVLWLVVAHSYRFVDWEALQDGEWDILRHLVMHNSPPVDYEIIGLTCQFAPHNPDLAVELLKTLAARGDEGILRHIAEVLSWPNETRAGWAIEFMDPQDYLDIIQNFERLPLLDFHVEECLDRMGQIAPMQVIDFVERRINAIEERREGDERYDAVPFQFSRAMDTIRSSPQYLDVLRRVRDWMLRDDPWFHFETPHVLQGISGGLGAPLYGVLMEWVDSGDDQKLSAVASIIREFNVGQPFYDLCREIIRRTDDEGTLGSIAAAIGSTPGAIWGEMSNFSRQRLKEVSLWLEDEDLRVRRFARQVVDSLQHTIEREQAREELERRSW